MCIRDRFIHCSSADVVFDVKLLMFPAAMAEKLKRHKITKFGKLSFEGFDQEVTTAEPVSSAINE